MQTIIDQVEPGQTMLSGGRVVTVLETRKSGCWITLKLTDGAMTWDTTRCDTDVVRAYG